MFPDFGGSADAGADLDHPGADVGEDVDLHRARAAQGGGGCGDGPRTHRHGLPGDGDAAPSLGRALSRFRERGPPLTESTLDRPKRTRHVHFAMTLAELQAIYDTPFFDLISRSRQAYL